MEEGKRGRGRGWGERGGEEEEEEEAEGQRREGGVSWAVQGFGGPETRAHSLSSSFSQSGAPASSRIFRPRRPLPCTPLAEVAKLHECL